MLNDSAACRIHIVSSHLVKMHYKIKKCIKKEITMGTAYLNNYNIIYRQITKLTYKIRLKMDCCFLDDELISICYRTMNVF